jgi:hypothetical protein
MPSKFFNVSNNLNTGIESSFACFSSIMLVVCAACSPKPLLLAYDIPFVLGFASELDFEPYLGVVSLLPLSLPPE